MRTALGTFLYFFPHPLNRSPRIPILPKGKVPRLSKKALLPYTGKRFTSFNSGLASETRRPTFSWLRHVLTQTAPLFERSVGSEWQRNGGFPNKDHMLLPQPSMWSDCKWLGGVLTGVLCSSLGVWGSFFFVVQAPRRHCEKLLHSKRFSMPKLHHKLVVISDCLALWLYFGCCTVFQAKFDVSFPALKQKYHFTSGLLLENLLESLHFNAFINCFHPKIPSEVDSSPFFKGLAIAFLNFQDTTRATLILL